MSNTPFVPTFDMTAFLARQAEYEKRASEIFPANKAAVLSVLAGSGITLVTVRFDGSGDSGQIEEIDARSGESSADLPDTSVEIARCEFHDEEVRHVTVPLPDAIEAMCYDLLESKHGGWENNEGGYGEFTFDVAAGTIVFDFNYRIERSENHYYEL